LAQNYLLRGSLEDICYHNAEAARYVGLTQVAQTWRVIHLLYSSAPSPLLSGFSGEDDAGTGDCSFFFSPLQQP
jgi:hypothetical protein